MTTDLKPFRELNEFKDHNGTSKKVPWDERLGLIRKQFPSVREFDWDRAFSNDLALFASVVEDVLKADQANPTRPGPRPALDYGKAAKRLNQLVSEDFTLLPFPEAFRILAGDRSIRHLASKTGLDRNQVHRLLNGKLEPDLYSMKQVSEAFGKRPSYFVEYRLAFIVHGILRRLETAPEASIGLFKKLKEGIEA